MPISLKKIFNERSLQKKTAQSTTLDVEKLPPRFVQLKSVLDKLTDPSKWEDKRIRPATLEIYKEAKRILEEIVQEEKISKSTAKEFQKGLAKLINDSRFMYIVKEVMRKNNIEGKYDKYLGKDGSAIVYNEIDAGIRKAVKSYEAALSDYLLLRDNERAFGEIISAVTARADIERGLTEESLAKNFEQFFRNHENTYKDFVIENVLPTIRDNIYLGVFNILNYPSSREYVKGTRESRIPGQIYRIAGLVLEQLSRELMSKKDIEDNELKERLEEVWKESGEEFVESIFNHYPEVLAIPTFVRGSISLKKYLREIEKGPIKNQWLLNYIKLLQRGVDFPTLKEEFIADEQIGISPKKALSTKGVYTKAALDAVKEKASKTWETLAADEDVRIAILSFVGDFIRDISEGEVIHFFPQEIEDVRTLNEELLSDKDVRVFSLFSEHAENLQNSLWAVRNVMEMLKNRGRVHILLTGLERDKAFEAFTDGYMVNLTPFYMIYPTYNLNKWIMLSVFTHETRHIKYGSFLFPEYPVSEFDVIGRYKSIQPYIERLAKSKGVKQEVIIKELERLTEIVRDGLSYAYNYLKEETSVVRGERDEEKEKTLDREEFINKFVEKLADKFETVEFKVLKEEVDTFRMLFSQLPEIWNILEDYRIDNLFHIDRDGIDDPYLNLKSGNHKEDEKRLAALRMAYDITRVLILKDGWEWLMKIKDVKDMKGKIDFLTNLLLAYSKMGDAFNELSSTDSWGEGEKEILRVFDEIKLRSLPLDEEGNPIFKHHTQDTFEATLETMVLFSIMTNEAEEFSKKLKDILDNLKNNPSNDDNGKSGGNCQGGNSSGGGNKNQQGGGQQGSGMPLPIKQPKTDKKGKDGKEGEKGDEEKNKESGSGGKGENDEKKNKEKGSSEGDEEDELEKMNKNKGNTDPSKNDMKRGKLARTKEKQKGGGSKGGHASYGKAEEVNVEKLLNVHVDSKMVKYYKDILRKVKVGTVKTEEVPSKRRGKLNVRKASEFLASGGRKHKEFLEKNVDVLEPYEGYDIKQRPIEIYIGIDTSGSMQGGEIKCEGEMCETFKALVERSGLTGDRVGWSIYNAVAIISAYKELVEEGSIKDVVVKLMGVANSGDYIEVDINDIDIKKVGSTYSVSLPDIRKLSGGTDLENMIGKCVERIKEKRKDTMVNSLRGEAWKRVEPHVFFLFLTDFGHNGLSADIRGPFKELMEEAMSYREDSMRFEGKGKRKVNYVDTVVGVAFAAPDREGLDTGYYEQVISVLGKPFTIIMDKDTRLGKAIERIIGLFKLGKMKATNIKNIEEWE